MRYILSVLLLAGCACCAPPQSAQQHELLLLKADYAKDVKARAEYIGLPYCVNHPKDPCTSKWSEAKLFTADVRAAGALLTAETAFADSDLDAARKRVDEFTAAFKDLPVKP